MAHLRRLLAYSVCVAIATPPLAYGQNAPPAAASTQAAPRAMSGVTLSASQNETYARLLINWPAGSQMLGTGSTNSGILRIRLPNAIDVDPSVFARSAPQFVAAAALSEDKRTLRMALVQDVRLVQGQNGNTQAFDLVKRAAPDPEPFTGEPAKPSAQSASAERGSSGDPAAPLKKMINGAVPPGAPRVKVQTSVSPDFTRIRLSNSVAGAGLPAHGFARTGDRMALAMPGMYALDIAELRANPPARVLDSARYSSANDTSLVLDLQPGSVVRHSREDDTIILDILPPGSDPNSIAALQAQALANVGAPSPQSPSPQVPSPQVPSPQVPSPQAPRPLAAASAEAGPPPTAAQTSSTLGQETTNAPRADPAPSGTVIVQPAMQGQNVVLVFGFDSPAPAVMFRRGDSVYALFATKAQFDVARIKPSKFVTAIMPINGEGVSGVRIVSPGQVLASPTALGGEWRLELSAQKTNAGRSITIDRETAADGTGRVKAIVPDAAATGSFVDPVVGDTLLLGLALGPASPLNAKRSFIEASLPETFHGLAVTPRTEDFELRRSQDGFVLVRPMGMALSRIDAATQAAGFASTAPGFIDYKSWQLGPKADFMKNLNRLRRVASQELNEPEASVRGRLDLARFLLAWDLGAEAGGILKQLKTDVVAMARSPELIALEGVSHALMGHNKEALDLLSSPEVASDGASQLWAGLAAQASGNAEEARTRFVRGNAALIGFVPERRAIFMLANAQAALELGDANTANDLATRAVNDAQTIGTKLRAQLVKARAMAKAGQTDEALAALTVLATSNDREVASWAAYEKALIGMDSGKVSVPDSIRALDSLRYAWRGDGLEIEILRRLGGLYIKAGDIRSGLSTMTAATSLRPDLPAARSLRDELYTQFRRLFLEGGADGMAPIQALALFYDFKDLAPIGPEGDRMVRGLADRLVALDLLPQATQLLQHQVDKRLEGFAKAQVATDLAAIYLMDRRAEPALKAIWNSRVAQLPEALNAQRRLIEAAAMAELDRTDHALEIIEFDESPDASRLRAELYMRKGDWTPAAVNARATMPAPKATFEPDEAGEVLRAAIATAMAGDTSETAKLVERYGPVMGKSAYAEAFNVVTNPVVPDPDAIRTAVASVTGGSPYNSLMKRLRSRLTSIEGSQDAQGNAIALGPQVPMGPTDGNPGAARVNAASLVPDARPEGVPQSAGGPVTPVMAQGDQQTPPASGPTAVAASAPRAPAPRPQAARPKAPQQARPAPKANNLAERVPPKATPPKTTPPKTTPPKTTPRRTVEAPRDPPPTPVTAR